MGIWTVAMSVFWMPVVCCSLHLEPVKSAKMAMSSRLAQHHALQVLAPMDIKIV